MPNDRGVPQPEARDQAESLSNEVLKLKVDDLFQEIEGLKRRVEHLEGTAGRPSGAAPEGRDQAEGVVSNPDRVS